MTVTAWTDPTAAVSYVHPTITNNAIPWNNPTNAEVQDNVDSTSNWTSATPFGNINLLYVSGFGFAIPGGSTIDGIECQARCQTTGASTTFQILDALLFKAGADVGTDQGGSQTLPATGAGYSFLTFGGATNLWGTTWTTTDVNNSGFGVGIAVIRGGSVSKSTSTVGIDVIELRIYYTSGGATASASSTLLMGVG